MQAKPGWLDRQLERLPLITFAVDVLTLVVEVLQMLKFGFSDLAPATVKPVKASIEVTTSVGLIELSYVHVQVVTMSILLLFFILFVVSERVELQAVKRPKVCQFTWLP